MLYNTTIRTTNKWGYNISPRDYKGPAERNGTKVRNIKVVGEV